jgi:flagellar motor switch protein FliN/FliY
MSADADREFGSFNLREGPVAGLIDKWTEALAQVLESMMEQRPRIAWQGAKDASATDAREMLWWEQPFSGMPNATVWVGAPQETWEHTGTATLKVAGLEAVASNEARSTWIEILNQSLSILARALTDLLGTEVLCEGGGERPPAHDARDWGSVTLAFQATVLPPFFAAFSPAFVQAVEAAEAKDSQTASLPAVREDDAVEQPLMRSRTMDLLLEVDLPVSISFGKTALPLRDVLKLTTGSIVELNRTATDPVDVLVNQRLIARGEVVVVEGNYGVRIQKIASRHDRLRSIP